MSKYLERKAKLVAKYNTDIPEITQEQLDWIRDNYDKKAHRNGIDWTVVAHVIDEHTLMLRYVVAHKYHRNDLSIEERARMVLRDDSTKAIMFERWHDNNPDDEWKNTRCAYFREPSHYRYWCRQSWLCRDTQKVAPGFMAEIRKLNAFKYFDVTNYFQNNPWICIEDTMKRLLSRGVLYEKLDKVGLGDISFADYSAYEYDKPIKFNRNETSLFKMLGLDRRNLEVVKTVMKEDGDKKCLTSIAALQQMPDMTDKEIEFARNKIGWDVHLIQRMRDVRFNTNKIIAYCNKFDKGFIYDWLNYVETLDELNYPLDDHYLFPKDFQKEDMRVAGEMIRLDNAPKDVMIKALADAMRADKAFKEFFAGSNGLIVKVPESAEDLYREGKKLHNCLATYVGKVASGKSLIFFVRRIEAPNEPYIAMEYCGGRITQCRYDCNKNVEDEKVINFVNLLAEKLRKRERRAA